MELIRADWIDDGEAMRGAALLIDRDGLIAEIGEAEELIAKHQGKVLLTDWRGHGLAPGCINAHSHCFQVFLRGRADHPKDFADWVSSHLYPSVQKLEDRALEIAAILAFAQMARAGVTSVGEFHYIHNAPDGSAGGSRIDALVFDAARRIGLRTAFLRCLYDSRKRPGQERFAEGLAEAQAATRELAKKFERDSMASVLPAPHSLHGASAEMIQAGHELAKELNSPFHIHLAEQQSDIAFQRALRLLAAAGLDKLGVLDERCVVVHGLWLDDGEIELLAERGGALVYNPTTNMTLGDGIAPIDKLMAAGMPVALGTDANYSLSIFAEMRATEQLQRVTKLRMGVLTGKAGNARPLLDMGRKNAARSLGLKTGRLAAGLPADLIAVDLSDPSLLPASVDRGGEHEVLNAMVSAMVPESAIRHVLVQGQRIVTHGELVSFAQDELAELVAEVA